MAGQALSDPDRDYVVACLAQGPRSTADLGVPAKSLEQLVCGGHIKPRMHKQGSSRRQR
jgi:hypothetical protein